MIALPFSGEARAPSTKMATVLFQGRLAHPAQNKNGGRPPLFRGSTRRSSVHPCCSPLFRGGGRQALLHDRTPLFRGGTRALHKDGHRPFSGEACARPAQNENGGRPHLFRGSTRRSSIHPCCSPLFRRGGRHALRKRRAKSPTKKSQSPLQGRQVCPGVLVALPSFQEVRSTAALVLVATRTPHKDGHRPLFRRGLRTPRPKRRWRSPTPFQGKHAAQRHSSLLLSPFQERR